MITRQSRCSVAIIVCWSGSIKKPWISTGHVATTSRDSFTRSDSQIILTPLQRHIRTRQEIQIIKRYIVVLAQTRWSWGGGLVHRWQFIAFTGDREVVRHLVPHNINVVATEGRNDRVVGRVEVVVVDVYRGMGPSLNARGSVTERGLRDDDILLVTASVTVGDRICGCYPVDRTIHSPLLS